MLTFLFGFLLAGILFWSISLLKTYHHVPVKELKRQANQNDEISKIFYKVVAFGFSLDMLLWIIIALSAGGFFVFLSKAFPWPVALFGCIATVWFGFAWMPGSHITKAGVVSAKVTARPLAAILEWLHTPLSKTSRVIERYRPVTIHTGLYTKQDLLEMIELQKAQIDNRVSKKDLDMVIQSLLVGDKKVADIMTPWRQVKVVATSDAVGPITMDELHKSGHTHFPVYQGSDKKDIVGILNIADMLDARDGGFVKDLMTKHVYYVHEEDKISEVIGTLAETKHPLFLVVDSKENLVGVVSLSEVLKHMVGELPKSDFGNHHDRSAVARKKQPKVERHIDETIELEDEDKPVEEPLKEKPKEETQESIEESMPEVEQKPEEEPSEPEQKPEPEPDEQDEEIEEEPKEEKTETESKK